MALIQVSKLKKAIYCIVISAHDFHHVHLKPWGTLLLRVTYDPDIQLNVI
jgi:hypothetical protein